MPGWQASARAASAASCCSVPRTASSCKAWQRRGHRRSRRRWAKSRSTLAALARLDELPQVVRNDRAHEREHSIEVQLPFLQTLLGEFSLVPLVVGDAGAEAVAQVLELLWGGDETLIVISSDLSHYLPYEQAQAADRATVQRILKLDAGLEPHEACGAAAINGAMLAARRHGLAPRLLDLRNSGDTAGERDRVVGYGAIAFEARPT